MRNVFHFNVIGGLIGATLAILAWWLPNSLTDFERFMVLGIFLILWLLGEIGLAVTKR